MYYFSFNNYVHITIIIAVKRYLCHVIQKTCYYYMLFLCDYNTINLLLIIKIKKKYIKTESIIYLFYL